MECVSEEETDAVMFNALTAPKLVTAAVNFRKGWQLLTLQAPRSMLPKMMAMGRDIEDRSPTFRRLPGAA